MTYLHVVWTHSFDDEPIEILSELDDRRYEVRKLERFRNGLLTFAGPDGDTGGATLSETPLPPDAEIAKDPQFQLTWISRQAFEQSWRTATVLTAA